MAFFVVGINYRSAARDMREKAAFCREEIAARLIELANSRACIEAIILSTCNRTEIYFQADSSGDVIQWFLQSRRLSPQVASDHLYVFQENDAIRHAFRVCCGLDSMALGEPQILGQVKEAVQQAKEAGLLGGTLDKLFQSAFAAAKKVRSKTTIGREVVSIATAAVRLADEFFKPCANKKILLIGAGEIIALCASRFAAQSPKRLAIANRSLDRAQTLAARFHAEPLPLYALSEHLHEFDIVISCTAAPHAIIELELIKAAMTARKSRPIFLLDLAVPRDIESTVGEQPNVFLYSIDDLQRIIELGMASRKDAVLDAEAIISAELAVFLDWVETRKTVPVIRSLRDSVERIRRHETELALRALAKGDDPKQVMNRLSSRLSNKFLHAPTRALNQADNERDALASWAAKLFHLRCD